MIGLFGGSFDPVHHGHLLVAQAVAEALDLTQLRFMPAREQPFKVGRHAASAADRTEMLRLAIEGVPRFALETVELERAGPSYTVETLRALAIREPGQRFAVLVGADAAHELPLWREAEALPGLADWIVFGRAGAAAPALPWPVTVVTVPSVEISATTIRARTAAGRSLRYWVPDRVGEFIHRAGLYLADAQEPPN